MYRIAVILAAIGIVFFAAAILPGDPIFGSLGELQLANEAAVRQFQARYNLDLPIHERFVVWVSNMIQGNLGESLATGRLVSDDLKQYVPATIELVTLSFFLSFAAASICAVYFPKSRIVHSICVSGIALPTFWIGMGLIVVFYGMLGIFPGNGRIDPFIDAPQRITGMLLIDSTLTLNAKAFASAAYHLVLPCLTLSLSVFGPMCRVLSVEMRTVMKQPYITVARSKGLREHTILWRHAYRNAVRSIIPLSGLIYATLLAGAILTETVFGLQGMGSYIHRSIVKYDYNAISAITLYLSLMYAAIVALTDK